VKTLFDPEVAREVKARVRSVRPDAARHWGKMNAAQAIAHCARGMEMAVGDLRPKRVFIGRIIGPLVKPLALGDDRPMKRNSPTAPELVVSGERDLDVERERLCALIDRFAAGGPAQCTTHPHAFFGPLAPEQWADLMYKHLDHHLRQFGA
jgi:uncharacterized protein DUF1569